MARTATSLKEKTPPQEADSNPADPFISLVEEAITKLLQMGVGEGALDAKEMNATIANAIKLIAAKAKITGEDAEDTFFGS
jgi:hypothetical protein